MQFQLCMGHNEVKMFLKSYCHCFYATQQVVTVCLFQGLAFTIAWWTCLYLQYSPKPWISSAEFLTRRAVQRPRLYRIIETGLIYLSSLYSLICQVGTNGESNWSYFSSLTCQAEVELSAELIGTDHSPFFSFLYLYRLTFLAPSLEGQICQ